MFRGTLTVFLILITLCAISPNLLAKPGNIRFRRIDVENGLSSNNVLSILQDHQGLIWIGTGYGLNNYNSYDFRHFNSNRSDSSNIIDNVVSAIYEDGKKRLWIGTDEGINRYDQDHGKFYHYTDNIDDDLSNQYIRTFFEDSKGILWVGTSKGVYYFDEHQNKFRPHKNKGNHNLRVNTINEDTKGRLLIGTWKGLFYLKEDKLEKLHLSIDKLDKIFDQSEIRCLEKNQEGDLWIGTEGSGMFRIHLSGHVDHYTVSNTKQQLLSDYVRVIKSTANQDLWIGSREGLNIFSSKTGAFESYQYSKYEPNSISFNSVRDILEDRSGGIWLATSGGGLNYYHPENNLFNLINQKLGVDNTLNYNKIKAIAMTKGNMLWIGTGGKGLNLYDIEKNKFSYFQHNDNKYSIINDDIKSISVDASDNLWIGTYNGLSYFDTRAQKSKNFSLQKLDSEKPMINQIHATLVDHNGDLWAGTNGAGLIHFDLVDGHTKLYSHERNNMESLTMNHIDVLFEDSNHNIWVGTRSGLDILPIDRSIFKHTTLDDIKTQSIQEDKYGNIWVGTKGQGLYLYMENDTHLNFKMTDGLSGNVVYAILEDNKSNLWMSTNNGLSKMIIQRDKAGKFLKYEFINYKKENGLQSDEFLQGSVFKSSSGQMFFGGINGLNHFYPEDPFSEKSFFPVVLTGLRIKNQDVKPGEAKSPLKKKLNRSEQIVLTYAQSEFTIEFAALNYLNFNKNEYAYKLEGFDSEWNHIGKQRNATFTYPVHGDYIFKIKSSTNPDKWPDDYTSIKIKILPPLWKRNWAYVLYIMGFGMLLYGYQKISGNYSNLKREKKLSKSKFEFFTNISHEIKTPLTLILAPLEGLILANSGNAKIHNQLMMMKRNGDRLINLINQLLDYRKFESGRIPLEAAKGNVVAFAKEVFLSFKSMAESNGIEFHFYTPDNIELWYDRDKLEKILLNLLSNAFKFTQKGDIINLVLSEHRDDTSSIFEQGYVNILVEDTGVGIPPDKLETIFERFVSDNKHSTAHGGTGIGLDLTKRLVKIHGGQVFVESELPAGEKQGHTVFTVKLPLGSGHLKAEQILDSFRDSEQIDHYVLEQTDGQEELSIRKEAAHETEPDQIMLIVEDNMDVRQFVCSMFEKDFQLFEAADGEEGKAKAFEIIPDIIISDVMMPKLDGISLCSTLKNDPRTSHIPVILLTARTPLVFRIEGIETGADDYVTKPFSMSYLKSRVQNLIVNRIRIKENYKKELILQPQKLTITSPDEKFLKDLLQFIEVNIGNSELNVEDIGKEVGMSRSNLYRKVKALTGLTIVEFIRSLKMKRAAQLLSESDLQVNEIAYMVGFQDVDYFRKCFKDEFKVTPSKYGSQA